MKKLLPKLLFPAVLVFSLTTSVLLAQEPTPKKISAEDKAAIKALFKGVSPSKYRLQFDNNKDVAGTKRVTMAQLKQINRRVNPSETAGYILLIVEGDNVVYVLAVGKKTLDNVLGAEKARKLGAILAKYNTGAVNR